MTPQVWENAKFDRVLATRIVGFVGPDESGEGRAVVVQYWNARGLGPHLFYVAIPVDDQWRAPPVLAIEEIEGSAFATFLHNDEQAPEQRRLAALIDLDRRAGRIDRVAASMRPSRAGPGDRFAPVADGYAGVAAHRRDGAHVLCYVPPDDVPPTDRGEASSQQSLRRPNSEPDQDRTFPRWIAVPKVLPRPGGDRAAHAALAVTLTPITLLYDVTVVPTSAAVYAARGGRDGRMD